MKAHISRCKNQDFPQTFEEKVYCAVNISTLWRYEFFAPEKTDMKHTLLI